MLPIPCLKYHVDEGSSKQCYLFVVFIYTTYCSMSSVSYYNYRMLPHTPLTAPKLFLKQGMRCMFQFYPNADLVASAIDPTCPYFSHVKLHDGYLPYSAISGLSLGSRVPRGRNL